MRALVVYESMFGNTARVAGAIASGLAEQLDVTVRDVSSELPAQPFDVIVIGGPTHAFSMSRRQTREDAVRQGAEGRGEDIGMREWLEMLCAGTRATPVAAFDTRVAKVRRLPGSAATKADRVVRRQGHPAAAPPESFYVLDTKGPLLDGELERAREWGRRLGAAVAMTATGEAR